MAKPRKYTEFGISEHVYVDSLGHYHFTVVLRGAGIRMSKVYQSGHGFEIWTAPKYVISETERLIVKLLKSEKARFYEHDRDGNRRYDDLRYHDPEMVRIIIRVLSREAA